MAVDEAATYLVPAAVDAGTACAALDAAGGHPRTASGD